MPSRFILQGLDRENDHIAGLEQVFSLKPITNGIVATAFMNAAGAYLLADLISEDADRIDIYVGVRNGVTSKQALETLMRSGIYPYVIDTASQAYIFHPKVFLASNDEMARLIVGSANVTSGGMAKNVEASLYSELSMRTDLELINSIYYQFESLKTQFPDNIFHVSLTDLNVMTEQGLLIDETKAAWKAAAGVRGNGRSDDRQRMRLKTRSMPRPERIANTPVQVVHIEGTELDIPTVANNSLLWKSGKLTRRDLNIPTGAGTNPTGSMLFKKGDATQDIDQRIYFRRTVFGNEFWVHDQDPRTEHMERCECNFRLIIKGIDYGVFQLKLSHNSRTDTRTYAQRNSMTQIHWGKALRYIAREDLLDSVCSLYAPGEDGVYTLVFDDE